MEHFDSYLAEMASVEVEEVHQEKSFALEPLAMQFHA